MCFYALAVLPLIRQLSNKNRRTQSWYADDSACVASLDRLKEWFSKLLEKGPSFGYFPEPSKSVLIIDRKFKVEAERMFSDVGIKVVSGHRFIGEDDECELYVKQKIEKWVRCVAGLSKAAESQPQAAFAALVKSIQCEWRFLQRVIPNCSISLFGGHS